MPDAARSAFQLWGRLSQGARIRTATWRRRYSGIVVNDAPALTAMTLRSVHVSSYFLGGGVLIILVLTLFQPNSALGLDVYQRFAYFGLIVLPILAACIAVSTLAFRFFSPRGPFVYGCLVASGLIAATAATPFTLTLEEAFGVYDGDDTGPPASFDVELLEEIVEVVPGATILWLLLNQLVIWSPPVLRLRESPSGKKDSEAETERTGRAATQLQVEKTEPCIFDSLGVARPTQLISLEAQQHYLRVYTTTETRFVLFGINAAAEDLRRLGIDGMLVHRSHWVNWEFVDRLCSRNGSYRCVLVNGSEVPIARRRWTEAQERFDAARSKILVPGGVPPAPARC